MKKIIVFLLLALSLISFVSCHDNESDGDSGSQSVSPSEIPSDEMFTDRDTDSEYSEDECITINLLGETAKSSSDSVQISGGKIIIKEDASYIVNGELTDGMIIVNAPETAKPRIILNGASISSSSSPIYVFSCDKLFLTLASETKNVLKTAETFEQIDNSNLDSAIFSKSDITINGSGSLKITSSGHGISAKDDLVISGGDIDINAKSHAIQANDSARFTEATLKLVSQKDGIHVENSESAERGFAYIENGSFDITSALDGISASLNIQINGGNIKIVSGGGSSASISSSVSAKGIKAASDLLIKGGSFNISSADDALHSNTNLFVSGGSFEISSGDDAFHADESLSISGGDASITKCYEGLEALNIVISGGKYEMVCSDDGINAAGGNDSSGFGGNFGNDMFGGGMGGGRPGRPGGMGGGMGGTSSNGSIVISGGVIYINSSGDGIDANGTFEMRGGQVTVVGPTVGDTATLDYDVSGTITGGTFIGTGASGMAQTFSSSEQGVISLSVGTRSAGTLITLKDQDGNLIVSHTPELPFSVVIISTPDMESGKIYDITVGDDLGSFQAN